MSSLKNFRNELRALANPEKAKVLQGFFKTGKGEYGEGDVFLGVVVQEQRKLVRKYLRELGFEDIQILFNSALHEERLVALLLLVAKYDENLEDRKEIFDFYLKNTGNINKWDLVDLSAPNIAGRYILEKGRKCSFIESKLFDLALSNNLWERRISIISTFYFIKNKRFAETLKISEMLIEDKHDLIHKAVGWMLREVGKRDLKVEEDFLKKYYEKMPRTMLRYAIEKFEENKRKKYLNGEI